MAAATWALICFALVVPAVQAAEGGASRELAQSLRVLIGYQDTSAAETSDRERLSSGTDNSDPFSNAAGSRRQLQQAVSSTADLELHWVSVGQHLPIDILAYTGQNGTSRLAAVLKTLSAQPGVQWVEVDQQLTAFDAVPLALPDDPLLPQQWAVPVLGVDEVTGESPNTTSAAWTVTNGSQNVVLCIIDTGVDYLHPDLAANMWVNPGEIPGNGLDDDGNGYIDDVHGYNFADDNGDPMDAGFHGTHLAGIVGAQCNNGQGVCGLNQNISIMACRFLNSQGQGLMSDAIKCLEYALRMGAHLTLNSYGGEIAKSQALQSAITTSQLQGQLFVAAAGNMNSTDIDTTPVYPASYSNEIILSVLATDERDQIAAYSNKGLINVDVGAPGSNIMSTLPNGTYGIREGTSQAAAYVAGAAALLMAGYMQAGFPIIGRGLDIRRTLLQHGVHTLAALQGQCATGGRLSISNAVAAIPTNASNPAAWPRAPIAPGSTGVSSLLLTASQTRGEVFRSPSILALQGESLTLTPTYDGNWTVCLQTGVALPHDPSYGTDITNDLVNGGQSVITPKGQVPFGGGIVSFAIVLPNGAIGLATTGATGFRTAAAAVPDAASAEAVDPARLSLVSASVQPTGLGSTQLFNTSQSNEVLLSNFAAIAQIAAFVSDFDLVLGGQVKQYERSDRLVISYISVVSASSGQPSTFQVELFFAAGECAPGTIRISWQTIGASTALVGVSSGAGAPAPLFQASDSCPDFPQLWTEQDPLTLPIVSSNPSYPNLQQAFNIYNKGTARLTISFSVQPKGINVLRPSFWHNPATDYQQTFAGNATLCLPLDGAPNPACIQFSTSNTLAMTGDPGHPPRFAGILQLPLRIKGLFTRQVNCTNQYLVLSPSPMPPTTAGANGSVAFAMSCGGKVIYGGVQQRVSSPACADYGPNHLDVVIDNTTAYFFDDQCPQLAAEHGWAVNTLLYLFVGAGCTSSDCFASGGALWHDLEVVEGWSHAAKYSYLAAPTSTPQGTAPVWGTTDGLTSTTVQPSLVPVPGRISTEGFHQRVAISTAPSKVVSSSEGSTARRQSQPAAGRRLLRSGGIRIMVHRAATTAGAALPRFEQAVAAGEARAQSAAVGTSTVSPDSLETGLTSLAVTDPNAVLHDSPTWVSASVLNGDILAAGLSTNVFVTYEDKGLGPGFYLAELVMYFNDPRRHIMRIPLTLHIN